MLAVEFNPSIEIRVTKLGSGVVLQWTRLRICSIPVRIVAFQLDNPAGASNAPGTGRIHQYEMPLPWLVSAKEKDMEKMQKDAGGIVRYSRR